MLRHFALSMGAVIAGVGAAPPAWGHGRSGAFVHLFEWSWEDVARECEEWLGPKGFAAVQISPPNEHLAGPEWQARYQPVSYNLTSRSGTKAQFSSMVRRCRAAGVGIYADVVVNHMAGPSGGVGVAGSSFGHRTYPLYSPEDFHHVASNTAWNCIVNNYDDKHNVQYCDLNELPDLCTSCAHVQRTVAAYINGMGDMGIAGIRIDAAKHMDVSELGNLLGQVNSTLFKFQEVPFGGSITESMYLRNGPVTEFGYANILAAMFAGDGLWQADLASFGASSGLLPAADAVVFLDNHDTQRTGQAELTYKSGEIYVLATMFMLAHPYGYPSIMSSYSFASSAEGPPSTPVHGPGGQLHCGKGEPWVCEHRRPAVANMVAWRQSAGSSPVSEVLTGRDTLLFCRGAVACLALNRGATPWDTELPPVLPAGEYCNVYHSTSADCPSVRVAPGQGPRVQVPPFGAVAVHVGAMKKGAAAPSLRGGA